MRKITALAVAILLVLPVVFASHGSYDTYGNSDYSSNKDFEYVNYHEDEDARRHYSDCGYYDYDYYGRSCHRSRDDYEYHRSRDFEFGKYHEDVHASSDYGNSYYDSGYNSFHYPDNHLMIADHYPTYYDSYYSPSSAYDYNPTYYDDYSVGYDGGTYSVGGGIYGYLPYNY